MTLEDDYIAAITAGDLEQVALLGAKLDALDTANTLAADPYLLGKAAVWYAAQGVPIFPIAVNSKRPAWPRAHQDDQEQAACQGKCGEFGHGLYDATTDPELVRTLWRTNVNFNVGMPTGRLFDVIDVDGVEGVANVWGSHPGMPCYYDALEAVSGHVSTPRDGGHHVYVPPTGLPNATAMMPGVDYRGLGGYVLLPPSVIDGRYYRWLQVPVWPVTGV